MRRLAYWISTVAITAELAVGGIWDVARTAYVRDVVTHLGYPPYFLVLLGSWKIAGAITLLVPGRPLLKEWAYAGSFFTYSGAMVSHLASGYARGEVVLLAVFTALTVISWATRPAGRRVARREAELIIR
jgi:hypothetical protein